MITSPRSITAISAVLPPMCASNSRIIEKFKAECYNCGTLRYPAIRCQFTHGWLFLINIFICFVIDVLYVNRHCLDGTTNLNLYDIICHILNMYIDISAGKLSIWILHLTDMLNRHIGKLDSFSRQYLNSSNLNSFYGILDSVFFSSKTNG